MTTAIGYRTPTADERERIRVAAEHGRDVTRDCGLCGVKLRTSTRTVWCEEHIAWEDQPLVRCDGCSIQFLLDENHWSPEWNERRTAE